jgi:hypothetical protein
MHSIWPQCIKTPCEQLEAEQYNAQWSMVIDEIKEEKFPVS